MVGVVEYCGVAYVRSAARRQSWRSEFDLTNLATVPRVDIEWVYQGATGDVIDALGEAGAKGGIIDGAGAGATSGTQGQGITYAIGKQVFVVTTTRAGAGRISVRPPRPGTTPVYSISGDDLTPIKARILLMLAIATTNDGRVIQRMFSEY